MGKKKQAVLSTGRQNKLQQSFHLVFLTEGDSEECLRVSGIHPIL